MMVKPRKLLNSLAPYALADMSVPAGKTPLQLAQNESMMAPPAHVLEAARAALDNLRFYPDADFDELRDVIARVHGLTKENLLCGCGSMELIALLTAAYLEPGDGALCSQYSYIFFRSCARIAEASIKVVPETRLTVDVDALLAGVEAKTRMVFVANPGNPTGTYLPKSELLRLRRGLRDDILLVIDEAYAEFVDQDLYDPCFDMVAGGNTVILRTFSKIYALAAMRVGWGVFPVAVADMLRRIQHPNSVAGVAEAAATAAMGDQEFVARARRDYAALRRQFSHAIAAAGLEVVAGHTNFVLLLLESEAQAAALVAHLRDDGIVVRPMGGYELGHAVRITLGRTDEMERVAARIVDWKENGGRA